MKGVREVTGLSGSLETFIEFLVVKATMGLLLGDNWGKTQGCSEQRGAEEKRLGESGGYGKGWDFCIPQGMDIHEQLL